MFGTAAGDADGPVIVPHVPAADVAAAAAAAPAR